MSKLEDYTVVGCIYFDPESYKAHVLTIAVSQSGQEHHVLDSRLMHFEPTSAEALKITAERIFGEGNVFVFTVTRL